MEKKAERTFSLGAGQEEIAMETLSENNFTISSSGPGKLRVTLDPLPGFSELVPVRQGGGNALPPAKEDGAKISCAVPGMAFGVVSEVRPP